MLFFQQTFNKDQKRGCLDYFIEIQQENLEQDGSPSDEEICGLLLDFVVAGNKVFHSNVRILGMMQNYSLKYINLQTLIVSCFFLNTQSSYFKDFNNKCIVLFYAMSCVLCDYVHEIYE